MEHTATVIKGKGRGKMIGFPTLNLAIPKDFDYEPGIYAGWVTIADEKYKGAFHYGPVPVFDGEDLSLEVFVIDEKLSETPEEISFELTERLREVYNFDTLRDLQVQIRRDIVGIKAALNGGR